MSTHGSALQAAEALGVSVRTVERAKRGVAGRRVLERMHAVAAGETLDAAREERIERYARTVARRGGWARGYVWDRRPERPLSWLEAVVRGERADDRDAS